MGERERTRVVEESESVAHRRRTYPDPVGEAVVAAQVEAPGRDLVAVCLGIAATISPGFMLGSLYVEMGPDLGFGEATSGALVAAFFGASAVLSAPLGRWVDRRGPAFTLRVALVGSAVLQAAIGVLGRSALLIGLLALVAGTANALCQVSANVWIARNVSARRQGFAFAAKQSSMPAASLVAGLALPVLVARFGWRWAFAAGVVLAAVALVGLAGPGDERNAGPARSGEGDGRASRSDRAALLSLAAAAAFSSGAAVTLGSFYVNSAVHAGVADGSAGVLLAVGSVVSIASRLVAGAWADRRRGALLGLVAVMLALGAASYLVLMFDTPWAHVAALPLAFGAGWAWPGVFNLSVVRAHPDQPGRATGITQSGTYVGATSGPLLFGILAERWTYTGAWLVAALIGAAAAVAVLNARRVLGARTRS